MAFAAAEAAEADAAAEAAKAVAAADAAVVAAEASSQQRRRMACLQLLAGLHMAFRNMSWLPLTEML